MTKARTIANLGTGFVNISDTGTAGTKVASGTTAQRGSTAGQIRFNSETGLAEYYTGTDFKIIDSPPTVTIVSPLEVDTTAGGNITFTITGSNFQSGAVVKFIGNDATEITASTTTVTNSTTISAVIARSSFVNAKEPYDVRVINSSGLSGTLDNQINVDSSPYFNTASGTLGTLQDVNRASSNLTTISATDAEGDSITFSLLSGTLPTGITLNSNGTWSGTANSVGSDTTYTFTVRATANSKTADRQFTITVNSPVMSGYNSVDTSISGYQIYAFTTSGTNINLTLNKNISADILLVGGGGAGGYSYGDNDTGKGGGGAGQVLYKSGHSLTAGNYTLYVGDGGAGRTNGTNSAPPQTPSGQNTTGFSVIANGGGNGGANDGYHQAGDGGSAGGQGARDSNSTTRRTSNKTSYAGWTSYGNSGGISGNSNYSGGGGGGAGGQGGDQSGGHNDPNSQAGNGGVGIDMSAIFGTNFGESGWFAGGGGGGTYRGYNTVSIYQASGGQGGGGKGVMSNDRQHSTYTYSAANIDGLANTGGGGGGSAEDANIVSNQGSASGAGGSGIILIRVAA